MSLATSTTSVLDKEYASRSELHFGLRISYARIAKAIREGQIEMHLTAGMIKFKVKEVVEVLNKPSRAHLYGF